MGINARKKATIKISIIILVFSLSFNCGLKGISAEVGPHTSSEEILVDKVFTFLAPNDFKQFDNLFLYENVNYYVLFEIVTPHSCEINVTIIDPDLDVYEIFKTEVNVSQGDQWFEVPFGTAISGNFTFVFSVIAELNLNLYIKISYDRALKCLYDVLSPEAIQNLELYQVNKFYDGTIAEHNVLLKTDVSYKFYIGRVSAIGGSPNITEVSLDYDIFDPNYVEFVIYNNDTLGNLGTVLQFDFGTAIAGVYAIKIKIHCQVEVVNVAYAIVEDYSISTVYNGTDPDPTPINGTTTGEFYVPIEFTAGSLVVAGGILGLLVVIGSVRRKRNSVSL